MDFAFLSTAPGWMREVRSARKLLLTPSVGRGLHLLEYRPRLDAGDLLELRLLHPIGRGLRLLEYSPRLEAGSEICLDGSCLLGLRLLLTPCWTWAPPS